MTTSRNPSGAPFAPGALVAGKYRLIKLLGEGAMGVVWSAVNEVTSREVALKLIWKPEPEYRVRLLREAKTCGMIRHKNVIEIHDVGQTDAGDPFLVMELLSGETLGDLLARKRRLSPPEAAAIGRDVARALAAAHAKGIVHRDLKPANIFLHNEPGEDAPVVKVLDFGVAKNLAVNDGLRTTAGGAVGSPMYMSPEQSRAERDIDGRADLWSLGVVLFEMLTGERPFKGEIAEVIFQIQEGDVPRVSRRVRRIDPDLDAVVAGCLVRDRDERLGPAEEIARLLEAHAGSGGRAPLPSLMEEGLFDAGAAPAAATSAAQLLSPGLGSTSLHAGGSPGYGTTTMRPSSSGNGPGRTALEPASRSSTGGAYSRAQTEAARSAGPVELAPPSVAPSPAEEADEATHRLDPRHLAPVAPAPTQRLSQHGPSGTVRIEPEVVADAVAAARPAAASATSSTAPVMKSDPAVPGPPSPGPTAARQRSKKVIFGVVAAAVAAALGVTTVLLVRRSGAAEEAGAGAASSVAVSSPSPSTTAQSAVPAVSTTASAPTTTPAVPGAPAPSGAAVAGPAPSSEATPSPPASTSEREPPRPAASGSVARPQPSTSGKKQPEFCGKFIKKPGCIDKAKTYDN